jgi:hypothetical protein
MKKTIHIYLLKAFFIVSFIQSFISSLAQDTSHIRISLLTCTPGEELYSTFGHTAIRIIDSSSVQDIVFNYGTFNFDDPGFYLKFIQGKLLYYVSTSYFNDFKEEYQYSNRGIAEQVLNMTADEKVAIQSFLYNNLKDENKYYKYDFFFDNCTTRPRDIILKFKKGQPAFKATMPPGTTFRNVIHEYLDKNGKSWSKLGIDILLGAPTDAVMSTLQSQFLPDNLMKTFDSSNQGHVLVLSTENLYPVTNSSNNKSFFTPMTASVLLLTLVILTSFYKGKWVSVLLSGFDGIFFFLTGALGIVLIFMMTATDHAMCRSNYNIIWALPSNTVLAFLIYSKKAWVKKLFGGTVLILILVLLSWFFLPQQMNSSLLPLVLLLLYRNSRHRQNCVAPAWFWRRRRDMEQAGRVVKT